MKPRIQGFIPNTIPRNHLVLWNMDTTELLAKLPEKPLWNLVVTSPPYNIGKQYEVKLSIDDYMSWQEGIIDNIIARLSGNGSVCWQVGNYVNNGHIEPLDFLFHPIFINRGLKLRNRIIWRYGHGMHHRRRFSGRYEVVLWYTKSDEYVFNLDAIRIPPKYPGKRAYKGPNIGQLSSHPLGKNPEDVWDVADSSMDVWNIPNVKASHLEKTMHPCQFPVGLAERLVLALSESGDRVFDPFSGVGSTGVAATLHRRRYWGCEMDRDYTEIAEARITEVLRGKLRFRSHARPLYDHRTSPLSRIS